MGVTQEWLQDRGRPFEVSASLRRIGWLRQVEIVLRQRDHDIGVVVQTGARDRLPCADKSGHVIAKNLDLAGSVCCSLTVTSSARQ